MLCFNETNCNPENLPFGGTELGLENFHRPFFQSPARSSNRGGGLAIYVNKNLTSEFVTDFKLIGDCVFFITVINCNKRLNLALKSLAH